MTSNTPANSRRIVRVDRAQVLAARGLLELAERGTGTVSPAIYAIAHAKRGRHT